MVDIEIVISRYNENLLWLSEEPFRNYRNIIYNKGINNDYLLTDKTYKTYILNNVGREGHTYLYHIIHNYDNLADITVFLPASSEIYYKKEQAINIINKVNETYNSTFQTYSNNIYDEFKNFAAENNVSSNNYNNRLINNETVLTLSDIRPYGNWFKYHFGDIVVNHYSFYGIFAIHKKHILQHPKSYYEVLIKELEVSSNPEVGHYYERSWAAIFHPIL